MIEARFMSALSQLQIVGFFKKSKGNSDGAYLLHVLQTVVHSRECSYRASAFLQRWNCVSFYCGRGVV